VPLLYIQEGNLNSLEQTVHNQLKELVKKETNIKILEAATQCRVSSSKISKMVRKMGFENFKQYKLFFQGQLIAPPKTTSSNEMERLQLFLEQFDRSLVDRFVELFEEYDRIVLFGLGPSYICLEYFTYKLETISKKNIILAQEEERALQLVDKNTLLIVFSVTGEFASYERLFETAKQKGTTGLFVLEEYDPTSHQKADHVFYLTQSQQPGDRLPYEKSRTVFFIFMEEVFTALYLKKAERDVFSRNPL